MCKELERNCLHVMGKCPCFAFQASQGTLRPSSLEQFFGSQHPYPMWRQPRVARRAKRGGERGIRTPGAFRHNGFQDRRIRPLCHLSTVKLSCERHMRQIWRVNVRFQQIRTNAHKCKKVPGFLRGLTLPYMNFDVSVDLPTRKRRSSRMRVRLPSPSCRNRFR